jgi:hypothetical protein
MVFLSRAHILYILSQNPVIYFPSINRLFALTKLIDPKNQVEDTTRWLFYNLHKYYLVFFVIKPTRCTKFTNLFWHETTCSGQFLCPSSGVYSLYTQQWYMSYRFVDSFRAGSGWKSILILIQSCLQTCMTYHCWVYSE